jgi:hypothetical protein
LSFYATPLALTRPACGRAFVKLRFNPRGSAVNQFAVTALSVEGERCEAECFAQNR